MNQLLTGDCRHLLPTFPDNHFDSCIVDTPYELGFMSQAWDKTGIGYDVPTWQQVLRVLKPGAHLLAFGGSRTYHRIACAIEDAGFEIRDQIMWVYGSGFPKSLDVSKALDKATGVPITAPASPEAQQWTGWGTALKPAHEPICVARKPLEKGLTVAQNVLKWGVGALNIRACRIGTIGGITKHSNSSAGVGWSGRAGTGDVTQNGGRWPANLIHDGSEEVVALFPALAGANSPVKGTEPTANGFSGPVKFGGPLGRVSSRHHDDTGSAARFFYCAKVSTAERGPGNDHPCVKPQALLRYLARLVTPPGGRILDHFTGSGSGPLAFTDEGFRYVAIDLYPHNITIAEKRLSAQNKAMGLFGLLP